MGSTVLLFWVVSTILAVAGYIFLKKNYLSQHPEHEQFGVGVLFGLPIFQIWITANICLPFVFVLPAQDDIVGQLTSDFDMINMTHEQWEGLYTVRDFMVIIFLVLAAFSAYALYGAYKREGFTAKKLKTATLIISCLYIIPIIGLIIFGFTIGQYFPINLILVIAAMILLQKKYNTVVENVFSVIQPSTPIQPKPEKTTPTPIKNEKSPEPTKRCPYCGEEILAVAKKCKHCGEWLDKEPVNVEATEPVETAPEVKKPVEVKESKPKNFKPLLLVACLVIALLLAAPSIYEYINDKITNAQYDQTEAQIRQNLGKDAEEYKKEKAEKDQQEAEEATKRAEEQKEKRENREKIISEVSKKYALIGSTDDHVFYLKGRKGKYEPKLYSQSVYSSSESSYSIDQFYDGSMQIQDFAMNKDNVVLIVNETDRNSTGFLVATLVLSLNATTSNWTDLTDGGCVKAEFTADKKKVKMTYGEIANPDAEYTLDYKYNYTTKEIEI